MARLGELLVADGVITRAQCEQSLQSQVLWGGRLGTNLIELGFGDADAIARALARQQLCAAALGHHFDTADSELQERLPADVAERFACIPLMRSGHAVIIAATAALNSRARAIIADELCCQTEELQVALAPEVRVRYQLEKVYGIPRDTRFLRVRGPEPVHSPSFEILDLDVSGLPELPIPKPVEPPRPVERARRALTPPLGVVPANADETHDHVAAASVARAPTKIDRRAYVATLEPAPTSPDQTPVGRVPLKRLAIGTGGMAPSSRLGEPGRARSITLGEVTRAIRRSPDRETIAELAIEAVAQFLPSAEAAMLLIVRGGVAIATAGYSRSTDSLPEVAVPLSEPGLIPMVIKRNVVARATSRDLGAVDYVLLSTLAVPDGDLVVVPISTGGVVVGVIALATEREAPLDSADSITAAAGAAFARLMRDNAR